MIIDGEEDELRRLLFDDESGIFEPDIQKDSDSDVEVQMAIDDFKLLLAFREENGFPPESMRNGRQTSDVERTLASKLKGLKCNPIIVESLKEMDAYGLLNSDNVAENASVTDLADALASPIFDSPAISIFKLTHVKKRAEQPWVASRHPCRNFGEYEGLFQRCRLDIKEGTRSITPYNNERTVNHGEFYVLFGMLTYIAEVGEKTRIREGIYQARLRCIIANGMEYCPLMRSFIRSLYRHKGSRVPMSIDENTTGYIYVLKSLSLDANITTIRDLYKIGFTTMDVETRIANASNETTYLCAPVELVAKFRVENVSPLWLEQKIHSLFDHVRLNVRMRTVDGRRYRPEEWFVVPIAAIRDAIMAIVDCSAPPIRYDVQTKRIVEA